MLKGNCVNCGHGYKVKEELADKALKCPNCAMPIHVAGGEEVDDDALRAEVLRLAGAAAAEPAQAQIAAENLPAKPAPPAAKARRRPKVAKAQQQESRPAVRGVPAERGARVEAAKKDYRALIIGVVVLMMLALGGVLATLQYQAQKNARERERDAAADKVHAAVDAARAADIPCDELGGIRAWDEARREAQDFEREYGGGEFLDVITESGERTKALRAVHDKRIADTGRVIVLLAQGRAKIESQSYAPAKLDLEGAVKLAREQNCPGEQVQKAGREAQELLASDAVKFGSMGWVLYMGEWMPPAKRDAKIRTARAEAMRARGLVNYRGRWITVEEHDRLVEEARRRRELAVSLANQERSVRDQLRQGADVVVLDAADGRLRWAAENWANPVEIKIEERQPEGVKYVVASLQTGPKGKWVLTMRQACDLSKYDELKIDFDSPVSVRVALGVWTQPERALYESGQISSKGEGRQQTVSFDLKSKRFKSSASQWAYRTAIVNPDKTYMISLFFYKPPKGPATFTNGRRVKKKAAEGEAE